MLTENKFSKYLLYAIGEITLVVIGILIALSVNNWNDIQKTSQNSATILKDYRSDLVRDTLFLAFFIKKNDSVLKSGQKNMIRISGPKATFDTVKYIAKFEHDPFISFIDKFNSKSTFNSMIGTDAFKSLNKDLKRKILNIDMTQTMTLNEKMINAYFDLTNEFTLQYPFGNNRGSGYLNEISWDIKNERDFVIKYTAMCSFRNLLINNKLSAYKSVMKLTKKLMSDIDLYISKGV